MDSIQAFLKIPKGSGESSFGCHIRGAAFEEPLKTVGLQHRSGLPHALQGSFAHCRVTSGNLPLTVFVTRVLQSPNQNPPKRGNTQFHRAGLEDTNKFVYMLWQFHREPSARSSCIGPPNAFRTATSVRASPAYTNLNVQ